MSRGVCVNQQSARSAPCFCAEYMCAWLPEPLGVDEVGSICMCIRISGMVIIMHRNIDMTVFTRALTTLLPGSRHGVYANRFGIVGCRSHAPLGT